MSGFRSALFKIENDEAAAVSLCLLQSVLIGLPRLFTLMVGGAVFIDRYSADNLPFAFIAASILLPAVGFFQLFVARRVSFIKLQLFILMPSALVTLGFILLLNLSNARWPAFALFVWYAAEFQLGNVVLWNTANRIFTVRQGKRLFGLIGSGEILTAIVGGLLTPFLLPYFGAVNLLSLSMIGFLLALVNFGVMTRICSDSLVPVHEDRSVLRTRRHESLFALFRSRYLVLIFLTYAMYTVVSYFFSNIFFFELDGRFSSSNDVAAFLGQFFAAFSVLSLLSRGFLSGRVLVRYGLRAGMLVTPVAVFIGYLTVVIFGTSGSLFVLVFWAVVATRLVEKVFWGAFGQPSYYTLYQPLSRERRIRVQATAETILGPLAGGITGLALLFLSKGLALRSVGLSAFVLPLVLAWVLICLAASREYSTALTAALKRRGITGGDLEVSDPTSMRLLEQGLESHRPLEVLYCLRLLQSAGHPRFDELLHGLVAHVSADVRRGVYEMIRRTNPQRAYQLLAERLIDEADPEAKGALLRALGAGGGEASVDLIAAYLRDEDVTVRRGALVALTRNCGEDAHLHAQAELADLLRSNLTDERIMAAKIIGELEGDDVGDALTILLSDDDIHVRRAALRSVGTIDDDEIWRLTVANLDIPAARVDTVQALIHGWHKAFPSLVVAYHDPERSRSARRLILQVFGRAGSKEAIEILKDEMQNKDRGLLSDVLWSLHLCNFHAVGPDKKMVEETFGEEITFASQMIAAQRDFGKESGALMLASALEQELEQARRRIFLLLSFLYDADTLMKILSNFRSSPALRDLALELFESEVKKHHSRTVMPILLGKSRVERAEPIEWQRRFLIDESVWASSWTRAAAVDLLGRIDLGFTEGQWAQLIEHPVGIVRETSSYYQGGGRINLAVDEPLPAVERVRILHGLSIFHEIDGEVLVGLGGVLDEVRLNKGDRIFEEGDHGSSMFIVLSGCVRLSAGGEIISKRGPGEIFGELSALEAATRTEAADALVDSFLFRLSGEDLHAFMANRIEVVRGIISVLCQRVRLAPIGKLAERKEKERETLEAGGLSIYGEDYLSSLEKVLILKTAEIFSGVDDDILTEVASRSEEVRLKRNEVLFEKGDAGTTTYIVAAGRIRIHIADQWIADATERAVVGELAALSSEPRTASVTAADDTLLLALDQESLFELMWDQHEIVRGIIHVLISRLRRLRSVG